MASGTMSAGKSEANVSQKNNLDALVLDLTCPICLQLFSEPVSLPCGHIYCFGCLKTMGQGLDQHRCPECLKEFHGAEALVKNFKMCSIVETYKATAQKVESIANPLDVSHSVVKTTDSAAEEENTRYHKGIATADGGQTERKDGFQIGSGSSEQPSSLDQEQDKAKMEMDEPPAANRLDVAYSAATSTDSAAEEENTRYHKGIATVDGGQMERKDGFQIGSGSSAQPSSLDQEQDKAKMEMDEPKFRLASQVTELSLMLEMAESVLTKEQEQESEVSAANGQLREKTSKLLGQMKELLQSYSAQVMQLIEEELGPGEASLTGRVNRASEKTNQLRHAMLRAESLLTEQDEAEFNEELRTLQPHIVELLAKPVGEEEKRTESNIGVTRACPKLEAMSTELRERIGEIQRSLRNTFNPSEVTFDPETAHPNLILSDDLKRVTFSTTKQPYPPSPKRFTSFFQVLSSQSFSEGEHCWEVELEVSPWLIGVCYSGKLARSGLTSALESSRSSWCLMWFNNLLTAFEQSHSVPLKRTTVSRKLEIILSFKTHRLSFYNISPVSGKTHVYTFKANLTEPVHLAYRMMSGHPKGSVTINS